MNGMAFKQYWIFVNEFFFHSRNSIAKEIKTRNISVKFVIKKQSKLFFFNFKIKSMRTVPEKERKNFIFDKKNDSALAVDVIKSMKPKC